MAAEKQFTLGGVETVDVLVSSNTTNGQFSVLIETCPPEAGPPPHLHHGEDEFFMPLEGSFETFDGKTWTPLPATGAWAPRRNVHTWRNSGGTWGKLLVVATGNSFDKFLEKFGKLRLPEQLGEAIALSAAHGIDFIPPAPETEVESLELVEA